MKNKKEKDTCALRKDAGKEHENPCTINTSSFADKLKPYSVGFEENDDQRSNFIRLITMQQLNEPELGPASKSSNLGSIPKTLVTYWHDPKDVPNDVRQCMDSWNKVREDGFEVLKYNDESALAYIFAKYGPREIEAFSRCRHPAMRSDYFRMCFVLAEGGLYVDTDDVLVGDVLKTIYHDNRMKLQPLCYDITTKAMVPTTDIWRTDFPSQDRIFYVNNNPIAAPAKHPVLQRALNRATNRLLGHDLRPEIQSTTGPGNLTASLAAHAWELYNSGSPRDFELLGNWDAIAETRWELSYRSDARNWRNMDTQ